MLTPGERLKNLADVANNFKVDKNTPVRRYYRSGAEMLRMGNIYLKEESLESAYVLYMKYLTLFLEKIRSHPEFKTVSQAERSHVNANTKEVMMKSERLKILLRSKYEKEYNQWRAQEEEGRIQAEEEEKKRQAEGGSSTLLEETSRSYKEAKERSLAELRDKDARLFHQFQQDQLSNALREIDIKKGPDQASRPQIPDRSIKPHASLGLYSTTEQGSLRTLIVPSMAIAKFLSIATPNTEKNVETCGILAGKLAANQFRVTHVLVPKQKGTPDSCDMSDDDITLFDYQDKHELITLGWIHTHPSQTAFLSSVDLHNHLSYQLMLPEAVAIVCAPKFNDTGFFVLTPNYGLDYIARCREKGFHPHPKEPPLFCEGSHVQEDRESDIVLVDLR